MKTKQTKYKDTEIGRIPEDWRIVRFGEYVELKHGHQFRHYDYKKIGIKVFKITQIKENGAINLYNCSYVDKYRLQEFKNILIKKGDILMALTGATIGKIARVKEDYGIILQNYRVGNFIPFYENRLSKDFLYFFLCSKVFLNQMFSRITRSAQQNIGKEEINKMLLILPQLSEQQRIGKILSDLDAKIELNKQMNKTIESIGQVLFKRWFVDFEFPNDKGKPYKSSGGKMIDSVLGKIPKGWNIVKLRECGRIVCGKTPSTKEKDHYGDDILFITIPDMRGKVFAAKTERKLSFKGAKTQDKKELPKLAVCVSCIASPGLVSLTSDASHTNQQINSIVCNKKTSPYFMYLSMIKISEQIKQLGLGGTATLNLNTGDFSKIKIIYPANLYMKAFNDIIAPIFDKLLFNINEVILLSSIRESLLPRLMSGRIRVEVGS